MNISLVLFFDNKNIILLEYRYLASPFWGKPASKENSFYHGGATYYQLKNQ